jgi:pimeloyl-ACP methyl ester carboxylesterase
VVKVRARPLIVVGLVSGVLACLAVPPGSAVAAGLLARCASPAPDRALCGRVTVPLDRSGVLPGSVSLRVEALPPTGGATVGGTVLALAGGPGQAAVPLLGAFSQTLAPVLRTRQLVTFDQRGTGGSGRLRCAALSGGGSLVSAVGRCASELGPRRAAYTTAASVGDVEAVRSALGVEKLVLWGTSYGTKVALLYAAAYPQHVDRLVLDSVVPPDGIDPFQRSTLASIPRVLRTVCAGACRFTSDPAADLTALARRLARAPLHGPVIDGRGRAHRARLRDVGLLGLLLNGDFDRSLRAGIPAAVRSALAGDPAPLLRLADAAGGDGAFDEGADSDAVYAATTCQDGAVPWAVGTPLAQRRAAVDAGAAAIPASAFAPFDRATVRAFGTADLCRAWPESPVPQPAPPLPATPTLILSGDEDLRTPRADAAALAARLPGARLLEVPDAAHGVLFSDPTSCAQRAVAAFVGGSAPGACRFHEPVVPAPAPAPRRRAEVRAAPGVRGRVGRTVRAVLLTLDDAIGQALERLVASGGEARSFGGLRAGSASLEAASGGLRLRGYAYVPGVSVSGLVPRRGGRLTVVVGGAAAAHGQLAVSRAGVRGRLDGVAVRVPARLLRGAASGAIADAAPVAAGAGTTAGGFPEPSPLRP